MAPVRKPLQGLWNVVRFNWHFYLLAGGAALGLMSLWLAGPAGTRPYAGLLLVLVLAPVLVSLLVTAYLYDFSGLYQFAWLPAADQPPATILTVSAGFDEASTPLAHRYPLARLLAIDFYDAARHTEVSIQRARRAYLPFPGTRMVDTRAPLPLPSGSIDLAVAFLAAHEIRDDAERTSFFAELSRVLAPNGVLVVVEHLRNPANFFAYTLGFLHFHSRRTWLHTFRAAGLWVGGEKRHTPFITLFYLMRNDRAA